jgi:hypothetical protein
MRLGRIRRLIITTPDYQQWFHIDLENLTVSVKPYPAKKKE